MDPTISYWLHNEFVQSAMILVGSVLVAQIFHMFLVRWARKAAEKTATNVDDRIVRATTIPTYLLIISIGLYFSIKTLSYVNPYFSIIHKIFFVIFVLFVSTIIGRSLTILISQFVKIKKSMRGLLD